MMTWENWRAKNDTIKEIYKWIVTYTGSRGDVFVVRTSKLVENLWKMGYFDRVTVSLYIPYYTANQETEGS